MGLSRKVLYISLGLVFYYFNPLYIRSSAFKAVDSLRSLLDLRVAQDPDSLQLAVANVTGDIDQLTSYLQDFFQSQPDDTLEISFREFLGTRAARRHKDLESFLDWTLGFYKFMWPFLLVYILMKLSGSRGQEPSEPGELEERQKSMRRQSAVEAVPLPARSQGTSVPRSTSLVRASGDGRKELKTTMQVAETGKSPRLSYTGRSLSSHTLN